MPLEAPTVPADGFESFDVLYAHVNASAKEQGYAIVKMRCSDYKNGAPRRYDLSCVHGANKKEARGVGLRDTSTINTGCPWRGKAVQRVLAGDRWIFKVTVNQHNHEAQDPVAYPTHRKRTWPEAQKDKIRQIFKTTATGSRGVAALMRERYPDQVAPRLLPPVCYQEADIITSLLSVAQRLPRNTPLISRCTGKAVSRALIF